MDELPGVTHACARPARMRRRTGVIVFAMCYYFYIDFVVVFHYNMQLINDVTKTSA
jgi:hypothetical protein